MDEAQHSLFWTGTDAGTAADAEAQVYMGVLELGLVGALLFGVFTFGERIP